VTVAEDVVKDLDLAGKALITEQADISVLFDSLLPCVAQAASKCGLDKNDFDRPWAASEYDRERDSM
jgi:hypothetical protein